MDEKDRWNAAQYSSTLNSNSLQELLKGPKPPFTVLTAPERVRILHALLYLRKKPREECQQEINQLLKLCEEDPDEWVQISANLIDLLIKRSQQRSDLPALPEVDDVVRDVLTALPSHPESVLRQQCLRDEYDEAFYADYAADADAEPPPPFHLTSPLRDPLAEFADLSSSSSSSSSLSSSSSAAAAQPAQQPAPKQRALGNPLVRAPPPPPPQFDALRSRMEEELRREQQEEGVLFRLAAFEDVERMEREEDARAAERRRRRGMRGMTPEEKQAEVRRRAEEKERKKAEKKEERERAKEARVAERMEGKGGEKGGVEKRGRKRKSGGDDDDDADKARRKPQKKGKAAEDPQTAERVERLRQRLGLERCNRLDGDTARSLETCVAGHWDEVPEDCRGVREFLVHEVVREDMQVEQTFAAVDYEDRTWKLVQRPMQLQLKKPPPANS